MPFQYSIFCLSSGQVIDKVDDDDDDNRVVKVGFKNLGF